MGPRVFIAITALALVYSAPALAQRKSACELLPKSDAEALLRTTYLQPTPYGKNGSGCQYNVTADATLAEKLKAFTLEVTYWDAPNPQALENARKSAFDETQQKPMDVPGLADAAVWSGAGNTGALFVIRNGMFRIHVGPSALGLDTSRAVARKVLAALDATPAPRTPPGSAPTQVAQRPAPPQVASGKGSASGAAPGRRTVDMASPTTITAPTPKPDPPPEPPVDTTWLNDSGMQRPDFARALYSGDFTALQKSPLPALSYAERLNSIWQQFCPAVFSVDASAKATATITAAGLQMSKQFGANAVATGTAMAVAADAGRNDAILIGALMTEQDPFQNVDLGKICGEKEAARFAANLKRFINGLSLF